MIANLDDLKNSYSGSKCFIIGAGPSVAFLDLSQIHDHLVIAVNSAAMLMPWLKKGKGRFWISNDSLVIKWSYFKTHIEPFSCVKLIRTSWAKHARYLKGKGYRYFRARERGYDQPIDDSDAGLTGVSSVPTAIDLAILLGAQQVYLLGVDHKMVQNKSHFWQFWHRSKWPQRVDKSKNYRPEQKHQHEIFEKNLVAFEHLNNYAQAQGVDIYNLNKSSAVKVFPKIRFEEAF